MRLSRFCKSGHRHSEATEDQSFRESWHKSVAARVFKRKSELETKLFDFRCASSLTCDVRLADDCGRRFPINSFCENDRMFANRI